MPGAVVNYCELALPVGEQLAKSVSTLVASASRRPGLLAIRLSRQMSLLAI
jgi:hypothetical protein